MNILQDPFIPVKSPGQPIRLLPVIEARSIALEEY